MNLAHDLSGNIGNTPLLRLPQLARGMDSIEIYAKAEYFNPGGSVKDRPALNMILEGERRGALTPGKTLIDSTSGNTGIAYAMLGAARGYKIKLCLPKNASPERIRILKAYGAELVLTPAEEGSDGAIRRVREIVEAEPGRYFYPDQYSNPANWQSHFNTTAPEIMAQTENRVTHFVTLLGTSGTFVGTARRFRRDMPKVECVSAQPSTGFHGIEGTKHMPASIIPAIYDDSLADRNLWIETEDAHRMVRRLAREAGLLVGISAGGNVHAALMLAKELAAQGKPGVIVTVLCDGADKYLSEHFWDDAEMIKIERGPWREMVNHAQAAYPNECCGAMIGTIDGETKTVTYALALDNVSAGSQAARYELRPEDLLKADREARERKLDLIGIYHSHPDCDAYFSETDLKNSCPWYSFVVLSIRGGKFDHANSWLPNAEQTHAEKEELEWPKS